MLIGLKCNRDLLQQLTAVQNAMRAPSRSDVMRRLIQDAYQKIFAVKLPIDSITPNNSPLSDDEPYGDD